MSTSVNKSLHCRFYQQEYPNEGDYVVIKIKSIAEMGAYCSLLEYNDIEGMILLAELSRMRITAANKFLKVGQQEVCKVTKVDRKKGFIDLSKEHISNADLIATEDRWNRAKAVHSILRHVARKTNYGVQELYETVGWPVAREYSDGYAGFEAGVQDWPAFCHRFHVLQEISDLLYKQIKRRLVPQISHLRATFNLTCFSKAGIEGIKKALRAGLKCSSDEFPIDIRLMTPPRYTCSTSTIQRNEQRDAGLQILNQCLEAIGREIAKHKGSFEVKQKPVILTQKDEETMKSTMEHLREAHARSQQPVEEEDEYSGGLRVIFRADPGDEAASASAPAAQEDGDFDSQSDSSGSGSGTGSTPNTQSEAQPQ